MEGKDEYLSLIHICYTPRNASDTYKGWITLRYALSHSVNIPAVQLLQQTGVSLAKSYAEAAGITFDPQDDSLALALGGFTQGVTPLSLAGAYTCFADGGTAHEPALIRRITDSAGKVVYEHTVEDKRVFSEETAFIDVYKRQGCSPVSSRTVCR